MTPKGEQNGLGQTASRGDHGGGIADVDDDEDDGDDDNEDEDEGDDDADDGLPLKVAR